MSQQNKEHSSGNIGFISLGCPKALVDSEQILTQLRAEGYGITGSYEDSDLVIINTCGFIDDAIAESVDAIEEAMQRNGKVIVTGCLGSKSDSLLKQFPNLLGITGPHATQEVLNAVHSHIPPAHDPFMDLVPRQGVKLTPGHYAYLKISEGCNHHCTFCIIPSMRGKLVSRPVHEILQEARNLVEAGVKEILVISQDTSAYGSDLRYRTEFFNGKPVRSNIYDLASNLGQLGAWVRLHYVYPYPSVDDLIPLMADGLVLPYLDIPFQHASPSVLKNMRRPAHSEKVLERIGKWRQQCPDIAIRSTFITGFPGETDRDFEQLLEFITEARLDRVGCFTYSPVEGATANEIEPAIPEEVKAERQRIFMQAQQEISRDKLRQNIGKRIDVIVDEIEDGQVVARSKRDAPEIDGLVYVDTDSAVQPGDRIAVDVYDSDEHDLYARMNPAS